MVSLPQEAQRGWIPLKFDNGIGAHRATFNERSLYFGELDTFIPGQTTLPLLATATELSGESGTDDFGAIGVGFVGGRNRVIVVKGEKARIGTSTSLGAATTVTNAQGRQVIFASYDDGSSRYDAAIWICGPLVRSRITLDGENWFAMGDSDDDPANLLLFGYPLQRAAGSSTPSVVSIHAVNVYGSYSIPFPHSRGLRSPFHIGNLDGLRDAYVAVGAELWKIQFNNDDALFKTVYTPAVTDIVAGCTYRDELAISDGDTILLWHPSRPPRYWPIWGEDGCPPDMSGRVVALTSIQDHLLAVWQLDNLGGCIVFWGRYNAEGRLVWHPRTKKLTGDLAFGFGNSIALLESTDAANPVAEYTEYHGNTSSEDEDKFGHSTYTETAQGFKVESDCTVPFVELHIKRATAQANETLVVEIQGDNAGVPDQFPIANGISETMTPAAAIASFAWVPFRFATPPSLTAGTQYHLVIRRDDDGSHVTEFYYWNTDSTAVRYGNGAASGQGPSAWTAYARDRCFRVMTTPAGPDGRRYLWLLTADGSNGLAYCQPHPHPGWNPRSDTGLSYEDGTLYAYTPWLDMIQAGEFIAILKEMAALAELTSAEVVKIAYRPGPDATAEESADWGDGNGTRANDEILLNNIRNRDTWAERPQPDFVQFRIGMDHASALLTPVLYNLFLSARALPIRPHTEVR